jgi:HD-GYP domain-containing protein (c-di-GMP phosphodiesterase class II)
VGKVAVPDAILNKPASLDEEEWGFMRRHTILGERILSAAPALREVAALVRASHERYDGDGYPDKLVGDEIPMGARIVAVCDAFDAMTSDRPYRSAQTVEMAAAELRRCSGSQFDPVVVDAFCAELGLDELNPHDEAADTGAEPMEAPRPELAAHLMRALERFPHETAMNPSTP